MAGRRKYAKRKPKKRVHNMTLRSKCSTSVETTVPTTNNEISTGLTSTPTTSDSSLRFDDLFILSDEVEAMEFNELKVKQEPKETDFPLAYLTLRPFEEEAERTTPKSVPTRLTKVVSKLAKMKLQGTAANSQTDVKKSRIPVILTQPFTISPQRVTKLGKENLLNSVENVNASDSQPNFMELVMKQEREFSSDFEILSVESLINLNEISSNSFVSDKANQWECQDDLNLRYNDYCDENENEPQQKRPRLSPETISSLESTQFTIVSKKSKIFTSSDTHKPKIMYSRNGGISFFECPKCCQEFGERVTAEIHFWKCTDTFGSNVPHYSQFLS